MPVRAAQRGGEAAHWWSASAEKPSEASSLADADVPWIRQQQRAGCLMQPEETLRGLGLGWHGANVSAAVRPSPRLRALPVSGARGR